MSISRCNLKIISLVLLAFSWVGPAIGFPSQATPNPTKDQAVEQVLAKLTLEQKVGQIFIFGFSGKTINRSLKAKIDTYQPGAVIAFKRNIENPVQISQMNYKAQKLSLKKTGLPLLIMVDQEGGTVTRVKTKPQPPSALSIGMTKNPKISHQIGFITGRILRLLGFNMNLAPVVDLSNPFGKNFIGNRSFGNDPRMVAKMAGSFSAGLETSDILPTAKHFPGHGGLIADSHKGLPKKLKSLDQIMNSELIPYKSLRNQSKIRAVMVAHIAFPNIDPSGLPATYSKVLVTDLLRKRLGFKGLVITDDLEMAGATSVGSIGDRTIKTFQAGVDMIMVAWSPSRQRAAYKALLTAVRSGLISEARLDESVRRIIKAKQTYGGDPILERPKDDDILKQLRDRLVELKNATNKISEVNYSNSLRGYSFLRNVLEPSQEILVFSADPKFYKEFEKVGKGKARFVYLHPRKPLQANVLLNNQPESMAIYYITGTGSARKLKEISKGLRKRVIVVNTTSPGVVRDTADYKAVINLNSRNYSSGLWLGRDLFRSTERETASEETVQN